MIKPGMVFMCDGKLARVLQYFPLVDLWFCKYVNISTRN